MEYRPLGRTGVHVSKLCLGTMMFGDRTDAAESGRIVASARDAGVNFIDTYFRTGLYPRELPFVLGAEVAGTVEAVGDGVTGLRVGDRVAEQGDVGGHLYPCEARKASNALWLAVK